MNPAPPSDPRKDLSPGARIAIGVGMLALGLVVAARGVQVLLTDSHKLASEGLAVIPLGMVLAFGGVLLAVPPKFARLRAVAAALLVTAFALTADWIAFGPGEREFRAGASSGAVAVSGRVGEMLGRSVFGVAAVLMDVLAVLMWVHGFRRHWRTPQAEELPRLPE
jgi:hypothetical protein